ncbi:MAG: TrmH family RNA methyltransferase [Treponema sp.]
MSRKKGEMQVLGLNSVRALCEHNKEKLLRLFFTKENARYFKETCKYLASQKRFYKMVEKEELEKMSNSIHHQGVLAVIREDFFPFVEDEIIDVWLKNTEDVLLTDNVGNSNNLGAIIRSMAFLGCKNLVIPIDEVQSLITPSTYRVAEGGMEFINVYLCSSVRDFINKVLGKMTLIATDMVAHHDISKIKNLISSTDSVLLILGNEVSGVSDYVKKKATHVVKVKGSGNIESLNVAQTATLFLQKLYEIKCDTK